MEREQFRVDATFFTLPAEILVYIISFVTPLRERLKLQYVSRRLKSACETPSLWRDFVWPYYHSSDETCVVNLLKTFGQHVKQLSFPDHVLPVSNCLVSTLACCSNTVHLSLPTADTLDIDGLENILLSMKHLQSLDVQWGGYIKEILELIISCNINLKVLTLREMYLNRQFLSGSSFTAVVEPWLHYWTTKGFVPRKLNLVLKYLYDVDAVLRDKLLLESHRSLSNPLVSGSGQLKVFDIVKMPMDLVPILPILELEFGKGAVLPCVDGNLCGFSGPGWLLLTHTTYRNKVIYKAFLQGSSLVVQGNHTFSNLEFLTEFEGSGCDIRSHQLEQLAIECPNLQRLSLSSTGCLKSLQGLRAIAGSCHNLQGLNLLNIPAKNVESQVQLWEILSEMKLTHLAVDMCVLLSPIEEDNMELISLFQKCKYLQALEYVAQCLDTCDRCEPVLVNNSLSVLSHFHALIHLCHYSADDNHCPTALHNIVSSFKQLKYLVFTEQYIYREMNYSISTLVCICHLEQLSIDSCCIDLPVDFMSSISAHGGLVHVVLNVRSVTSEGVTVLVTNSPNLLTFHAFIDTLELLDQDLEAALKKKVAHQRLFKGGSYKVGKIYALNLKERLRGNLLSFWY